MVPGGPGDSLRVSAKSTLHDNTKKSFAVFMLCLSREDSGISRGCMTCGFATG